jgi:ribonuclease BN (tRNA processing enzyme)
MPRDRRTFLFGRPGEGKSTLCEELARVLVESGRACWIIGADPGTPAFGIPGAVSLARWDDGGWRVALVKALCTLDAGRFRLPLLTAVRHLAGTVSAGTLLIDGPGVVRGVAGRELLTGLIEAARVELVLALSGTDRAPPLLDELRAAPVEVAMVRTDAGARRPGQRQRSRSRTTRWNEYLGTGVSLTVDLSRVNVLGTPPPLEAVDVWKGRQLGLLRRAASDVLGEVIGIEGTVLRVRAPIGAEATDTILVRDATRSPDGMLETAEPFLKERFLARPSPDFGRAAGPTGPPVAARVGPLDVTLVNGVYGDPLLHARVRHQGRSLLFDIGEGGRLSARVAHQVTDVFVSHAHMDHIGGFQWLLRSRLGEFPPCRVFGPVGLSGHIEHCILSFLWDRIGDNGPKFEVTEFDGTIARRFALQAGKQGCKPLGEEVIENGVLHEESGFRIRAVLLDHKTPVVAYAVEVARTINIRKDRLRLRGLEPGPWLTQLKQQLLADNRGARIVLPDGSEAIAGELGDELALFTPGKTLVYATDLADTTENRRRLIGLARNAHTLFCEAAFAEQDAPNAARNGHLTTRACGEIATAAGVGRLFPFHFSRRYADEPRRLYEEIRAACPRVELPDVRDASNSGGLFQAESS